jgi:spectinomycin phosphotransferase
MLTPPAAVTDREVLTAVAAHWLPEADGVEHLPWGFGAHHWLVSGSVRGPVRGSRCRSAVGR